MSKLRDLSQMLQTHIDTDEHFQQTTIDEIRDIKRVLFGDETTGEKGMKQKQDEMYEILVQAKGFKTLGSTILLIAAVIAVLKGWLN